MTDRPPLPREAADLERQGEWRAAGEAYAASFEAALAEGDLAGAADALRGGARALHHEERYEEAEELAGLSLEIAERGRLPRAAARAVNTLAAIQYLRRDYATAHDLFEAALERALDVGDDSLVGWTCMNLGVVANIRGDLREARTRYLEGIASFVRSGNKRDAALVYNNLGMVCADLAEWLEAEVCFDRGIEIARRLADVPLLAKMYANRAEPLLRLGETGRALGSLDEAERLAGPLDARGTLADAARFRGMVEVARRDYAAAERHLGRAASLARKGGLELEEAEALREAGDLHRTLGRHRRARRALERSLLLFRRLGADADAARVEAMLEREMAAA